MKKVFILLLVFTQIVSFAAAADKTADFSAGLEFGIENVNKADNEDMIPYLMPIFTYEASFLNDALDLSAELNYTFGFANKLRQSLYADIMLGYNLEFGRGSTLSFILQNEFDEILISPKTNGTNILEGIFTPAVRFEQEFNFGDAFVNIGAPITYVQYDKDAGAEFGLDVSIGLESAFGLVLDFKLLTLLAPGEDAGYQGLELIAGYEIRPAYLEVEVIVPEDIGDEGVIITPLFEYGFRNWNFYLTCEFAGVGAGGKVTVSPAIGVKFNF
ncbi:MAG: hypothetical protein LBH16_02750 [Treponema sp.]|nr:hypothetical protein [Treponema sp.]